jgi:gamma-glutamyl-gamma-aminobutyrate hydrolase PuuD
MTRVALLFRNPVKEPPYRLSLERAGLEPVAFTPGSSDALASVKGIVLTGGTDVDPALYGASPHPETSLPDRERDDYEAALLREALSRDMPVLAICRGMQLMNVVFGGTLVQHIENHRGTIHEAALEPPFAAIFGEGRITVNSRHHQALDRVGQGLIVTARDPNDGTIEGVVIPGHKFAVGVQWHPEDMPGDSVQLRLFDGFRNCF